MLNTAKLNADLSTEVLDKLQTPADVPRSVLRLQELRAREPAASLVIDQALAAKILNLSNTAKAAADATSKVEKRLREMTEPPLTAGVFVNVDSHPSGTACARVRTSNSERLLALGPGLNPTDLRKGDAVWINAPGNVMVGKIAPCRRDGQLGNLVRRLAGSRLVISHQGAETVVECTDDLEQDPFLAAGDAVLFDPQTRIAFERSPGGEGEQFLTCSVPSNLSREDFGGDPEVLDQLLDALMGPLVAPEAAALYGLEAKRNFLMTGPSGCGKTLAARIVASLLKRRSGREVRFAAVKPGEFLDPLVGMSERRLRGCFASLRPRDGEIAILFLDEIESIARHRGSQHAQYADRTLTALLAELDGFQDRGNVAVIAATNRPDLLDPALLERVSETRIRVSRPNREAARSIFRIHLPRTLPLRRAECSVDEMIDAAVSILYDAGTTPICSAYLGDGSVRDVSAPDLISGRAISQICLAARTRAFRRHVQHAAGTPPEHEGIDADDLFQAVGEFVAKWRTSLTRENIRSHVDDLPQIDVIAVQR